jgi:hypothetical protein
MKALWGDLPEISTIFTYMEVITMFRKKGLVKSPSSTSSIEFSEMPPLTLSALSPGRTYASPALPVPAAPAVPPFMLPPAAVEKSSNPESALLETHDLFFQAALWAIKNNHIAFLKCILQPRCDELRQRYQEALAFEQVRQFSATEKNRKSRVLLENLDAFFKRNLKPGVEHYASRSLQQLHLSLSEAYMAYDRAAFESATAYLMARTKLRVSNETLQIQFEQPRLNTEGKVNSPVFRRYLKEYRPMALSTPEKLKQLEQEISSLNTPSKLSKYIQALRIQVGDAEKADRDAKDSFDRVGTEYENYQQETYLEMQQKENAEKKDNVDMLLKDDRKLGVLEALQCKDVEEARELLTRQYDCRPMTDLEEDAALEEKSEGRRIFADRTLYVGVDVLEVEERNKDGKKTTRCYQRQTYKVCNPQGVVVEGAISQDELPYQIPGVLDSNAMTRIKIHLKSILEVTAKRGHTLPMVSLPTFFKPEISSQEKSLFAYATESAQVQVLAFMHDRYLSLGTLCKEIGVRKADAIADERLSWHDSEDIQILRELAGFYQTNPDDAPGLKDNMLSAFYCARAYVISADLSDKAAYLELYSKKLTLLEKQTLFEKLLQENLSHPRLRALLQGHAFKTLVSVAEIGSIHKPLMADALARPVTQLFFLKAAKPACLEADQKMLVAVLQESRVSESMKQAAVACYVSCYGGLCLDAAHLHPVAQKIAFHLRKALCAALQGSEGERVLHEGSQLKFLDALAALQGCRREEAITRVQQYSALASALEKCCTSLPQHIGASIQTALLQSDGMQLFQEIEAFLDQLLAVPVSLRLPLQENIYALLGGEWLYFRRSKTQAEQESGFSALAEILNIRSVQALRNAFTEWLLKNKNQPLLRQYILKEMCTAALDVEGDGEALKIESMAYLCREYRAQRQFLASFSNARGDRSPELCGFDSVGYAAHLQENPSQYEEDRAPYAEAAARLVMLEKEISAHCEREEVIEAYIHGFKVYRRLGIDAAALFAAQEYHVALSVLGPHFPLPIAPQRNSEKAQAEIQAPVQAEAQEKVQEEKPAYLLFTGKHYYCLIQQGIVPVIEGVEENEKKEEEKNDSPKHQVKSQLWIILSYFICLSYLHSKVKGQEDREQQLECRRVLYFLEQLKQDAAIESSVLQTLFSLLTYPVFFVHDRPPVIGMQHARLLNILQRPMEKQEAICTTYPKIRIDPRYVVREMEKNIAHWLPKLNAQSKKYQKAFEELTRLKACFMEQQASEATAYFKRFHARRMASVQTSIAKTLEKINLLLEKHPELIPPDLEESSQLDALLRIKWRIEEFQKEPKHYAQPGMDPCTSLMRRKSMQGDISALVPVIGGAASDRSAALYGSLRIAQGSLPGGHLSPHTPRHNEVLHRFFYTFCGEMESMALHAEKRKQLQIIMHASNANASQIARLEAFEERMRALGTLFAPSKSAERGEEKNIFESEEGRFDLQTSHMTQLLAGRFCNVYPEQIELLRRSDQISLAKFLVNMVFLYSCFEEKYSLAGLLDWLDRGPVLYKSSEKKYEGPRFTLITTGKKVSALGLIRLSGIRFGMKKKNGTLQEIRCAIEIHGPVKMKNRLSDLDLGCRTLILTSQLDRLKSEFEQLKLLGSWYSSTVMFYRLDTKTAAQHQYTNAQYVLMPEVFALRKNMKEVERELGEKMGQQLALYHASLATQEASHRAMLEEQNTAHRAAQEALQAELQQQKEKTGALEQQLQDLTALVLRLANKEGAMTQAPPPQQSAPLRFLGNQPHSAGFAGSASGKENERAGAEREKIDPILPSPVRK